MRVLLLLILNLTAAISCLIVGVLILMYGSIVIVEPNRYIVAAEVVLATVTIALNIWEAIKHE